MYPNQHNHFSMKDLFKNKNAEFVTAILLLSGRLKVDSVELFRSQPVVTVTLVGKYVTSNDDESYALVDFLDKHGDMAIDDIINALKIKTNQRG